MEAEPQGAHISGYAEQLTCRAFPWVLGIKSAGSAKTCELLGASELTEITLHFHVGLSIAATLNMAGVLRDV